MLYTEFLKLTHDNATFEEYSIIDNIYMEDDKMTKRQSVTIWEKMFGKSRKEVKLILPEYLKNIKESIRSLKDCRQDYEDDIVQTEINMENAIQQYILDNPKREGVSQEIHDYFERNAIENIRKEYNKKMYEICESYGNDMNFYIIYNDGSTCCASGTEIVTGEVTPRMQNIAYAHLLSAWDEFDTRIGDFKWDVSIDEEYMSKDEYMSSIEIELETEWGLRQKFK